jgi:hypothetical protein
MVRLSSKNFRISIGNSLPPSGSLDNSIEDRRTLQPLQYEYRKHMVATKQNATKVMRSAMAARGETAWADLNSYKNGYTKEKSRRLPPYKPNKIKVSGP